VSFIGNTSSRPKPRSRITVAVHGPMPLISQSRAEASALGSPSSSRSSSAPEPSASPARRSVAIFPALRPAERRSLSLFAMTRRASGKAWSEMPPPSTAVPHATMSRVTIALAA
jgi:hypothetical protein